MKQLAGLDEPIAAALLNVITKSLLE